MNVIDQNIALTSLEKALGNHSFLVDSRTEKDELSFLVDFASLINFYDKSNRINGDWSPFLLKDPIFLLASIAKTPFEKMHTLFLQTCIKLEEVLDCKKEVEPITPQKSKQSISITNSMNQLFDQLIRVFNLLERWVYYMLKSPLEYNLKTYLIREVKEKYNQFLSAILWLKEQLHVKKIIAGIHPVNHFFYKSYNPKIWKLSVIKIPYNELLQLKIPLDLNSDCDFFRSLKETGELSFAFFNSIIEYASIEFDNIKVRKDLFPDTLLLRTFTKLMAVYKNQINGLTSKHLEFYYKNILRQKKSLALPDAVFVCAELSDSISIFKLPKKTFFNGGYYLDQSDVLYETLSEISLNSAAIVNTYTLSQRSAVNNFSKLYLKEEADVGVVETNEDGEVQNWKTFGSQNTLNGNDVALGFAIASPMLFLLEGQRNLTLKFTFLEDVLNSRFFDKGTYYLSTEEVWFQIPKSKLKIESIDSSQTQFQFIIELDTSDPAIVAFLENPDGLKSIWPMFKMSYSQYSNLEAPLTIQMLEIDVDVKEMQSFQLYNDFGALETENPFQPLGPTPNKDQNFMIGSAEVFSKPVNTFSVEMNWNNLPENFSDYYDQYNKYLKGDYKSAGNQTVLANRESKKSFLSFFKNSKEEDTSPLEVSFNEGIFNDSCFKTTFQLLQNRQWSSFNMNNSNGFFNTVFSDEEIKDQYPKSLFQGQLKVKVVNENCPELDKLIAVKSQLGIEKIVTIEDCFNATPATLKIDTLQDIQTQLDIQNVISINERFDIGDFIKIKENLDLEHVFENEQDIKATAVFEINSPVKISDLLVLNDILKVENIRKIETELKNNDSIFFTEESISNLTLNIQNQLSINETLKISDVFEINSDLLLNDLAHVKLEEVFQVKKDITLYTLFEEGLEAHDPQIVVTYSGELVYENQQEAGNSIDIIGTLKFENLGCISHFFKVDKNVSFLDIIAADIPLFKAYCIIIYEELYTSSVFGSSEISEVQKVIDPAIQITPLELTETTSTGFIRMQLVTPKYGFGASLYPKVVSAIALYNAELLIDDSNPALIDTCNEPYTPIVGLFEGEYTSHYTYDFRSNKNQSNDTENYPIACFYYAPFKTYKVYDSAFNYKKNKFISNGFPGLLPSFSHEGQLFLELEEVATPAAVSFYFELALDYTTVKNKHTEISYTYLSGRGWQTLTVLSDTTNGFSCSGIITFNIPIDITKKHRTMTKGYWISIAVNNNPDNYPQTTFLKTNGFKLQRTGKKYLISPRTPEIKAETIESPHTAIPDIAGVIQPFSSFGGKAAETEKEMNKRVSIRLKTKDRLVTSQDYFQTITETFSELFYVKVTYNKAAKKTEVYVVQKVQERTDSNAFLPLVNACLCQKIQLYIKNRASSFANIEVANFELKYIKIIGDVTIAANNDVSGISKRINTGLNTFLSPWIKAIQPQITIDKGVNVAEIAEFIKNFKSVIRIANLSIQLGIKDKNTGLIHYGTPKQHIYPFDIKPSVLLVPSLDNQSILYK
ncbi:MAG: hypothetical protein ABJK28_14225 [Algibacter sp.]